MPKIDALAIEGLKKAYKVDVIDPLPVVTNQVGSTCGIYALDTALNIRGIKHPPPRKLKKGGESLREIAKKEGLTQLGELFGAMEVLVLASLAGAQEGAIHLFSDSDTLWKIVSDAVTRGKTALFPFCVDDTGDPKFDGQSPHWALLIGRYEHGSKHALATHWGNFYDWDLDSAVKSNLALQKWDPQSWVKVVIKKDTGTGMKEVDRDYYKDDAELAKMEENAKKSQASPGYPKWEVTRLPRAANFTEINLALTLRGQCVVI